MDCNTLLTLCLEIIDALQNESKYYLQGLYENALLSENRKMMENLQTKLFNNVEEFLSDDQLPVSCEDVKYTQDKVTQEMNQEFFQGINPLTMGKPAIEFYYELQTNVGDLLHRKQVQNDELSAQLCKNHLDSILQQITDVNEISSDDLRSPFLMANLEELFNSLITDYLNKTKGTSQCRLR